MNECYNSSEKKFYILAFFSSNFKYFTFLGILLMYLVTVLGNLIIVILVICVDQLHNPMYFFLCNLSIIDIVYISTTLPKLLSITLTQDHSISFHGCVTQQYFFLLCVDAEVFILTSMAYDRYIAICFPLQYSMIMKKIVCITMATCAWLIGMLNSLLYAVLTSMLSFCYSHEINHFFCELKTMMRLSSSDISSRETLLFCEYPFMVFLPFIVTVISYVYIIATILNIRSRDGKLKAFSGCTSHLTTVALFYGAGISLYLMPESNNSQEHNKTISLLYVAIVPMLNPLVYSLRNKEVLGSIRKIFNIKG
ncbi:olfactory receptor 1G1-like [Pelobates fuscus]|uniref:olfactory receptor 1G1-like n=1 Tax=Pelobates fuscus TaxID=191477 RepID=UPI002FE4E672